MKPRRGVGQEHILLTKDVATLPLNGAILTIAKIIKPVMASAAESELAELYLKTKRMVPIHNTLKEMGWPQPKSPIQTDNSTAAGFTNKVIVNKAIKSLDMKLWWLRDRESQDHFKYYWALVQCNKGDYITKLHPLIYHEMKRRNPYMV